MRADEKLQQDLERFFSLRQHSDDQRFRARLQRLQDYQGQRLTRSHTGLLAVPANQAAIGFLLEEVYGGKDLLPVARDIRRAVNKAASLLPDRVMATSASVLEAAILTQELDEALTDTLHDSLDGALDDALYSEGFRALGRESDRRRQLDLIGEVGHHVDRYVRGRMIQATFRMVRRPVHAAGFGNLYDFLDRGFGAMRELDSAGRLLAELTRAEATVMAKLYAGHPAPFAEPFSGASL
ncbi:MAG: FFLEELY motif protein [Alcanivoracaceae bacterium]